MKKSYHVKLCLDIILFISFIVIFNFTNGSFHEIAGLGTSLLFLIHILINKKKFAKAILGVVHPQTSAKTRFKYGVTLLLFVSLFITIASGISIFWALFPLGIRGQVLKEIHSLTAHLSLALIGIHLGFHWSEFVSYIIRIFRVPLPKLLRNLSLLAIVLLFLFGGYQLVSQQIPEIHSGNQGFSLQAQHQAQHQFQSGKGAVANSEENNNSFNNNSQAQASESNGRSKNEHKKSSDPLGLIFDSVIIIGIAAITHKLTMRPSLK